MVSHIRGHYAHLAGRRPGGVVEEGAFGLMVDSGLDCDTFNVIVTWAPEAKLSAGDVARCRRQFGERRFSWWVGPDVPAAVSQMLSAQGLAAGEPEPAMAMVPAVMPAGAPVEIIRVQTAAELRAYAEVLSANWSPPDGDVVRFYESVPLDAIGDDAPVLLLLAMAEGRAVGTAELSIGDDRVAGLFNVATLGPYRRRGIGEALTRRALSEAAARAVRRVELQASDLARGLYERLGFRIDGQWREHQPPIA